MFTFLLSGLASFELESADSVILTESEKLTGGLFQDRFLSCRQHWNSYGAIKVGVSSVSGSVIEVTSDTVRSARLGESRLQNRTCEPLHYAE
jgi:hypothetical protein